MSVLQAKVCEANILAEARLSRRAALRAEGMLNKRRSHDKLDIANKHLGSKP
ncbi:hypothetical protein [Argonema galeatum]|uniref:hypothetical protein n=1 Tax=Argonema galeatum TaxID=2942762 RepID=UPI0020134117|nr:hypothetical protein [Argonema galeatum]MCL1468196.1 hypothetical protein [Argonema galeatum A003/A1]